MPIRSFASRLVTARFARSLFAIAAIGFCNVVRVQASVAQPTVFDTDIDLRAVVAVPPNSVRLVDDPLSDDLFFLTSSGLIHRVDIAGGSSAVAWTDNDHGLDNNVLGFASGHDGSLYVVGNVVTAETVSGRVMRATPGGRRGAREWSLLAETEPHQRSATAFDHLFNGAVVSPDGQYLYLNSGSRTDHGEIQNRGGAAADLRELPITSAILRIPLNGTAPITIKNHADSLAAAGYLYADGVRNSFDLAFGYRDRLFATENSGDRDDGDELNWIREGHHYGFPWRMGGNDTPMQFAGYNPNNDLLLNPNATAVQGGFFYDDPAYPPPPSGVAFTAPIANYGPDAAFYRDATTGAIVNGAGTDELTFTFTAHRSPLGLVFDTANALKSPYMGAGFVLSWTDAGSALLGPFNDPGEDLLKLDILYTLDANETPSGVFVERLATGFLHPIDAVFLDNKLYVLEQVFGGTGTIWELTFPSSTDTHVDDSKGDDGVASVRIEGAYPNPASNELHTKIVAAPAVMRVTVDVIDVVGRRVRTVQAARGSANMFRTVIDVGGLPQGVYLLRASGDDGVSYRPFTIVR